MANTPPILDYAQRPRLGRTRKWIKRIALLLLIVASLYGGMLGWLYWGWRREQSAVAMVARVGGSVTGATRTGPAILDKLVPGPLVWVRERKTAIILQQTSATDEDIRTLKTLTHLDTLYLGETQITDAGLVHLRDLHDLQVLILMNTRITDAGLVHLKALTRLQALYLDGTKVTDAGLVHLTGLVGLQGLWLTGTRVTDAGLVHLKNLAGLQALYLNGTKVTVAGTSELQKTLPNCQIVR